MKNNISPVCPMSLDSYREIAPQGAVELVYRLSETLKGKRCIHVNSTKQGGGVAEMLNRFIPFFNELGIKTRWDVVEGTSFFFKTTKSMHNALQGQEQLFTQEMYDEFIKVNEFNAEKIDLDADFVIIHDPQPAGLICKKKSKSTWLWRCHIDISRPQRRPWHFLRKFVNQYDGAIFSLPNFSQKLTIPQFLMYPSIDPLSEKNRELTRQEIDKVVTRYAIPQDKPVILQVSRFDRFKDPLGVIEAYRIAKRYNDCCLILAGGSATDDPEGAQVLQDVLEAASKDEDIFVLDLPADSNHEINALQRAADIVIQKSTKEGFGLTVAEAMWKGKPVIGGAVGGIGVQIIYGETGYTVNSIEGCAYKIRYLLNNPQLCKIMGEKAKDYTRRNFLITRHLCDYLALLNSFLNC